MSKKKIIWVVFIILIAAAVGVTGFLILSGSEKPVPVYAASETPTLPATPTTVAPTPEPTPDPKALKESEEYFNTGTSLLELEKYEQAKAYFSQVQEVSEHYALAQDKLKECLTGMKADYMQLAQEEYNKTHYIKAQSILNQALKEIPDDAELMALLKEAEDAQNNLEPYSGPLYHVFFHSLIVYPELCFTGDSMTQGYNAWMTTVYEFKLMIREMYERGYILVDLAKLYRADESGKMVANELKLPKGKKPLVISIDDVSYYKYMEKDGFAKRLVLDKNGEVATLVKTPEGNEIVTRDGDVMPILDDFIKDNPDFSLNNAKGTLALTGYEGILGYNVRKKNPDWEKEKAEAQKVVDVMKANGWSFANHSYTHRRSFAERTITMDYLKYDTQKWLDEVGSIVGPTNLFISPFGAQFPKNDPRVLYLVEQGFNVYCGVGNRAYSENNGRYIFMERINLDGFKMNKSPQTLEKFFDVKKVYDPARPPFSYQ